MGSNGDLNANSQCLSSTGDLVLDKAISQWMTWDKNPQTREQIECLVREGRVVELRRRLCSRMTFGTAGLRAPMGAGFARINDLTVIQSTQMATPYSRPAPFCVKCVANRTTCRAVTFIKDGGEIKIASQRYRSSSALCDGNTVYMSSNNNDTADYEEGETYFLKNITIGNRYGHRQLYFGRASVKFRAASLALTEEMEKAAKEALCPPSIGVTGEEEDIFSRGGYLSLQGQVEKIQAVRMAEVQGSPVPVLDMALRCGQKLLDVSLWRDEALCELYPGDEVELTHLKVFVWDSGNGKMNSSTYTTVKTAERKVETAEVQVVGVCEGDGSLTLLCEDFTEFCVPADLYQGSVNDLIRQLPAHIKIMHVKKRVIEISFIHEE